MLIISDFCINDRHLKPVSREILGSVNSEFGLKYSDDSHDVRDVTLVIVTISNSKFKPGSVSLDGLTYGSKFRS